MRPISVGCAATINALAGMPARLQNRATGYLRHAAQWLFASPAYRVTLIGRRPVALRLTPADPWPGDAARGATLVAERSDRSAGDGETPRGMWNSADLSHAALCALHGFDWLRDLRELGGAEARRAAREIVADWLAQHRRWSLPAWRADVTGRRLAAWLTHYETFFASGEDRFRERLAESMVRQLRHLDRAWRLETRGAARIAALKGLIYGGLCLGREKHFDTGIRRLLDEIDRQILPDGGHVQRNPALLLLVLRDFLDLRGALVAAKREVPAALQRGIDRIGPMIEFLRLGDGTLARFNGTWPEDPRLVDMVVDQANPDRARASRAPATGFERLAAGDLLAIVDGSAPAGPYFDDGAHAGTLSFEVSAGSDLLIVNCGAARTAGDAWLHAQRTTAAHSTVTVNERNSSQLLADGRLGARRAVTKTQRSAADGAQLLTMSHNGYLESDGIVHQRRLYLSGDGADLRGEDSLSGRAGVPFAVRFHLHPAVNASLLQSGRAALLKLRKGGGWRLRASAPIELTDSVYFEGSPEPKRSLQIVIPGVTDDDGTTVKWALQREGAGR